MNPYEGSASLAPEAREKVLQTFRHTLQLVRDGRNEEALLGCDFILKMDARFAPAHRLLAGLRGVPAGQRIDVAPFAPYFEAAPEEAASPVEGSPFDVESTSTTSRSAMRPPSAGGLDDLVFDDVAPRTPAPAPAASAAPAAAASEISFAGVVGTSGVAPSVTSAGFAIGSGIAPPAAPSSPAFEDLDMSISTTQGSAGLPPAQPRQAPAAPAPGRPAPVPGPLSTSLDPRIMQFLKQGDDAMARGNPQEAIDLWSRVFLIDLSNEEASRRIDQAREMLADSARKVDVLLAEGTQLYDAGNLSAARSKFLDVLALSEHDATARAYLKQIDAALAAPGAQDGAGGDSEFLRTEIEAPATPSYADDNEPLDPSRTLAVVVPDDAEPPPESRAAAPPPKRRAPIQLDLRVLLPVALVVLVAIAGGAWWTFRGKSAGTRTAEVPVPAGLKARTAVAPGTAAAPAPATATATARPKVPDEDPIARAQALFLQGKVDAAIQVLLAVPDNDPRHNEALAKIDQYRNVGAPPPVPTVPNSANLEQLRAQGLAAMKTSRYIDAFKALDPVVKAYPNDTEAAQALLRAREAVDGLRAAVKSYSEGDYDSSIKLLWELRRSDPKNQDVEEYLVNSYVNSGIQALQSGNNARATEALQDAAKIRSSDREVQRLLRFSRKYPKGPTDLMARIYVRHLSLRP